MKRGIAFFVALFVVAIGGALWFWKARERDKTNDQPVTQRIGSAPAKRADPPKLGRITVTVSDDKGHITDAIVRIEPDDGEVIAIRTNANGEAVADKLGAGSYAISASATGHEP